MNEILVVEHVSGGRRDPSRRIPAGLPMDRPSRDQLEQVLRDAGIALVAVPAADTRTTHRRAKSTDRTSRLRAELTALVDEADESELARLEAAVSAESRDELDERFWGPAPDPVTAAEAVVAGLTEQFAQRRELIANSINRQAAADLLAISAQSVTDRLESQKLIGIKVGREWRLPRWQFDPDNVAGTIDDLDELQAVFPGGPVSLSRWIMRPNAEFGGRTPRDVASADGSAGVITVARALTAAGW